MNAGYGGLRPEGSHGAHGVSARRPLGVILVDSPNLVRAALAHMIAQEEDLEVLVEASTADDCLGRLLRIRRRTRLVVVTGLGLPGEHDSFWLIRSIRDRLPTVPILVTATRPEGLVISRALFVGADGYVDKESEPREFIESIRQVARGELVLSGVPAGALGSIAEGVESQGHVEPTLTQRELEVLEVSSEGLTARQIGYRLGVRERTITTHLGRIYKKLGTSSRMGAIVAANHCGLVVPASRI